MDPKFSEEIPQTIVYYKAMESMALDAGMLNEVKSQYSDMASGGDGGMAHYVGEPIEWDPDGEPTAWKSIRENNYPTHPDEYFQEVCDLMGWRR